MSDFPVSAEALALHRQIVIFDGLSSSPITSVQAQRMQEGGLTAANMTTAWVDIGFADTCRSIAKVLTAIEQQPNMGIARTVQDIHQAKAQGHTLMVVGLQNGKPVEDDLDNLEALYHLGLRIMQLTYNDRNYIADGCTESFDGGLSDFGQRVVKRMAELGMVVDLSHCSERTCREAIAASPKPVIISHANPSGQIPNPRNKSDEVLRQLADRGGVIGVCGWSPLLARDPMRRPDLAGFVDVIDHLVNLIGIDHVGIGTDHGEGTYVKEQWDALYLATGVHSQVTSHLGPWWGFEARFPVGLEYVIHLPRLTQALMDRGYSDAQIEKLWGGNFLRVFSEVWKE